MWEAAGLDLAEQSVGVGVSCLGLGLELAEETVEGVARLWDHHFRQG